MSETMPVTNNPDNDESCFSSDFEDVPVNNENFTQYEDDTGRIEGAISELEEAGIYIEGGIEYRWKDKPLLDALEAKGVDIAEAIVFTSEFNRTARHFEDQLFQEIVELPAGHGTHRDGRPRRAESGARLDLERVKECGIDPTKVLMFRVTQPSDEPMPELYWTTDFIEVRGGLGLELGKQRETSVILIDTLDSVASNGGLMRDINDDAGIAVRQLGLNKYDQASAVGVIPGV